MSKTNSVYFNADEKEIVVRASKLLGMSLSAFCRSLALERARVLLYGLKQEVTQTA